MEEREIHLPTNIIGLVHLHDLKMRKRRNDQNCDWENMYEVVRGIGHLRLWTPAHWIWCSVVVGDRIVFKMCLFLCWQCHIAYLNLYRYVDLGLGVDDLVLFVYIREVCSETWRSLSNQLPAMHIVASSNIVENSTPAFWDRGYWRWCWSCRSLLVLGVILGSQSQGRPGVGWFGLYMKSQVWRSLFQHNITTSRVEIQHRMQRWLPPRLVSCHYCVFPNCLLGMEIETSWLGRSYSTVSRHNLFHLRTSG